MGGTLGGIAYGGLLGSMFRGTGLIGSLVGAIDRATIPVPIAGTEMFLFRTRWGWAIQRAPSLVIFGVTWLVYGTVITVVNLRSPGVLGFDRLAVALALPRSLVLLSVWWGRAISPTSCSGATPAPPRGAVLPVRR